MNRFPRFRTVDDKCAVRFLRCYESVAVYDPVLEIVRLRVHAVCVYWTLISPLIGFLQRQIKKNGQIGTEVCRRQLIQPVYIRQIYPSAVPLIRHG